MAVTNREDLGQFLVESAPSQGPYVAYDALRERSPVYWSEALNQWLVTGYDEVMKVLSDPEAFSSIAMHGQIFKQLPASVQKELPHVERVLLRPALVFSDPPTHTRHRAFVNRPLTPRRLADKTEWLEAECRKFVDQFGNGAHSDLVKGFALPLSLHVVVNLFGADPNEAPLYVRVSQARQFIASPARPSDSAQRLDDFRHLEAVLAEFHASLRSTFSERPEDSLLNLLLGADKDERLSDDELFVICFVFLSAAYDTTISAISSTLYALLQDRGQLEKVLHDRSKMRGAIEESLRWESPVQRLGRHAAVDTELGGQTICAGDTVMVFLGAANRDPSRFPNPHRFDVDRDTRGHAGHMAFGQGIHFCVGAGLGRLETASAINALLDRYPAVTLETDWEPRWAPSLVTRQLLEFPVILEP